MATETTPLRGEQYASDAQKRKRIVGITGAVVVLAAVIVILWLTLGGHSHKSTEVKVQATPEPTPILRTETPTELPTEAPIPKAPETEAPAPETDAPAPEAEAPAEPEPTAASEPAEQQPAAAAPVPVAEPVPAEAVPEAQPVPAAQPAQDATPQGPPQ